ncbi:hypothetical protein Tco_1370710 [Tanacetum coccineum]
MKKKKKARPERGKKASSKVDHLVIKRKKARASFRKLASKEAPRIVHMGIHKKGVVGMLGLRIRTRGDTMSGVENRMIAVVEVIIGDGNGGKWAGVGRLEWLE